jgi:hypothetical protein
MTAYRVWQTDSSDDFAHSEPSVIVEAADWLQAVETWLGKTEGVTFKLINIRFARFFAMDTETGNVYGITWA